MEIFFNFFDFGKVTNFSKKPHTMQFKFFSKGIHKIAKDWHTKSLPHNAYLCIFLSFHDKINPKVCYLLHFWWGFFPFQQVSLNGKTSSDLLSVLGSHVTSRNSANWRVGVSKNTMPSRVGIMVYKMPAFFFKCFFPW
jgi:hypothetical protein